MPVVMIWLLTQLRANKLTIFAPGSENIVLTPPIKFTLERALEFIEDDDWLS